MASQSDEAIVLRLTEYSETSQIVTLFGAAGGLLRLIAKGVRRGTKTRFAVGLDLLEYGDVSYVAARGDAQLGTLTEWVQRDAFSGLRREPLRLYGAMYVVELVAGLTEEGDPHPQLFTDLLAALRGLSAEAASGLALVEFQRGLLRAIGYAPRLDACVDCKRPVRADQSSYFSAQAGGLVCRDCEMHHVEKWRLPPRMRSGPPRAENAGTWFRLLDYHITHVAGRRFRTAERVEALLGA